MAISKKDQKQIKRITQQLKIVTEKIVVRLGVKATEFLFAETPVQSGFTRSSWRPQIGVPFITDLSEEVEESLEVRIALAATAANEQNAAKAALSGYKLEQGPIFITNNTPHISELNDSTARQKPIGFVQRARARAVTEGLQGFKVSDNS